MCRAGQRPDADRQLSLQPSTKAAMWSCQRSEVLRRLKYGRPQSVVQRRGIQRRAAARAKRGRPIGRCNALLDGCPPTGDAFSLSVAVVVLRVAKITR